MVKTNIQSFTGEVEIASNLHVGDYLTANGAAANVLTITGNVGATFFVGDGGFLSNIATTLSDIVNQGNVSSNVLQFESASGYAGVGLVTTSNVGIQNTSPSHTLSVGTKIRIDDNVSEPSAVLQVDGRIEATRFKGDGGLLSNIATTLSSIVDQGNVASNVVKFSSASGYAGAGLVTDSNVGIQNTAPTFNLSVGSNLHVNDVGSNVLTVHGNISTSNLMLGEFSIQPSYGLNDVCTTSSGTTQTVQFQNATTSLVASSNIIVSGNVTTQTLISTANTEVGDRLKFSGSNVFVDTLRIADVAANLVTYDRTTGELLDSSGTFLNKFAVVSAHPSSALSSNATTVTNHGVYTLTTSNLATNSNTFNAFDGTANAWVSGNLQSSYYGGSNVFHEANLTQLSNLHPTRFGDWLAIEFPYKTRLRHMKLTPLTAAQFPEKANLYATNDSLTWSEIGYWEDRDPVTNSNVQTIVVDASEDFKKYALVATQAAAASNVAIQDWQLFTESFSIDGGKVAMATSAVSGGETVMDQHGPHLRGAAVLKKYPEIIFEEGKFDANDSTNTYVQAGYTVTASGVTTNNNILLAPWKVLDGISDDLSHRWRGEEVYVNNSSTATPSALDPSSPQTQLDTNTSIGEYLILNIPKKIKLKNIVVNGPNMHMPYEVDIYGRNEGVSTWTHVKNYTYTVPTGTDTGVYNTTNQTIDATDYYSEYAFVVVKTNGVTSPSIGELQLYGYEEGAGSQGDTSVDTTFTSVMNTPQTTGANVYVDGSLGGNANTNRVVGPAAANTAATYDTTGKYWTLTGALTSNISVEANTFLEGDQPHAVSVWFNSSNLVANASNSCIFSIGTEERLDHVSAAFSNNYQTVQRLTASDLAGNDRFGKDVAMNSDGTKVIVGAYLEAAGGTTNAGAAYIYTYDGLGWNEHKLVSPDNEESAQFGGSVSMSSDGTKVIVGAMHDDEGVSDTGAAYIFTYSGGSWDAGTKIVAPDKAQDDRFGSSVGMSGDGTKVIVGAYIEDHNVAGGTTLSSAGSAYIFTYTGSSWGTGTKIVASDRAASDLFGRSVAMNSGGTKAIVGADGGDAAYIFTYNGSSWVEQILVASDAAAGDKFGLNVAMNSSGTKVIVGAYLNHAGSLSDAGAAYIFTYNGSSWDTGTKIVASDKVAGDRYGYSVGMSSDGTNVIVGAYLNHAGVLTDTGSAYIFTYNGSSWGTGTKISAPVGDRTANDQFGSSVAMNGDGKKVIVGAYLADPQSLSSAGFAHVFTRDTTHHLTADLKLQSNTWHNLTYAYQGEGGSKVTYLDGRKVAEDQAEDTFGDYPPFAMTGYSQGGYVVSQSSLRSGHQGWHVFGNTIGAKYASAAGGGDTFGGTDTAYNGTNRLSSSTPLGAWLKIELPHKIRLQYTSIAASGSTEQAEDFGIYGSNDDNTWDQLFQKTGATATSDYVDYVINATSCYKYFAILVTRLISSTTILAIDEWKLYGHRENDLVRLPDPTNVLKYPHVVMTGPAQRGYVASASRTHTTVLNNNGGPWQAFDGTISQSTSTGWVTPNGYSNSTAGSTAVNGQAVSFNSRDGDWLNIKLPHKITLSSFETFVRIDRDHEHPTSGYLYASNDGFATFQEIYSFTDVPVPGEVNGKVTHTIPSSHLSVNLVAYNEYRIQVTKLEGQAVFVSITELQLYGTEEGSVPIQIGGGNIDKVANFRVYDKFVGEDQALEIWDAQKDYFGRAKSSMTLYKGRLGLGTTEPEGRLAVLDEPHNLEEFPPRAMTGYKNYFEGHGEFCVSASNVVSTTYTSYKAFNKNSTATAGNWWSQSDSGGQPEYSTSTGGFSSTDSLYSTNVEGANKYGQWLQIEFPYKINYKYSDIQGPYHAVGRQPHTGYIVGSNDLTGIWTSLHRFTDVTRTHVFESVIYTPHTVSTQTFKYFRLVIEKMGGGSAHGGISRWDIFGTREQGQSVLHDGQLTLTKNLTVPRIGPALDADDTPRRDRLVVEYNTSTNPTFEGAVRDTSGRGNDGFMVGTAAYDITQKAFTFSGDDGDAHITRSQIGNSAGAWVHSFSTWVNTNDLSYNHIFSIGADGDNTTSTLRYDAGTGANAFKWFFYGNDVNFTYGTVIDLWLHVVGVYDGGAVAGSRRLWVNGVESVQSSSSGIEALTLPANTQLTLGDRSNRAGDQSLNGEISQFKLYDCTLTAEEVKTLYDMGRCDEGHHVVNFSKTRVGIGLGDGEAPRGVLEIRGNVGIGGQPTYAMDGNAYPDEFPACPLHIHQASHPGIVESEGIRFSHPANIGRWNLFISNNNHFRFVYNGAPIGYVDQNDANAQMNFTGQHRTFIKDVPFSQVGELEGLIVSSDQNKYIKMSGGIEAGSNAITTNESLPIVSLSATASDKRCFGVISASEDPEERSDAFGSFVTPYEKEKGDTRVYINSVGEGAIWVSNIGGNLEAGDYITTSNVAGYGQKQESDSLKNYTVAKITMDCDFEPVTQPIQQILRSNVIQTYYLGDVHKVKSVPHEFVTTTVTADDAWSNVSINPSDTTYAEWSNLEANTQNTYTLTYTQTSNVVYDTKYTLTTTANVTESDPWDRVFVDPPGVTYAQYSNLEANTQSTYSLTFTQTTTDEKTPAVWSNLESNTQSLYNEVYYQSVEEEVASVYPGATTHTRVTDVIENELDAHGQIQWEDHATETEKAYKIRYLDVSGAQTDSANAVHIAAFVGCTYHCG